MDWKFENPSKDGKYFCIIKFSRIDYEYKFIDFAVNGKAVSSDLPVGPCWYYESNGWNVMYDFAYNTDYDLKTLDENDKVVICWLDIVPPDALKGRKIV